MLLKAALLTLALFGGGVGVLWTSVLVESYILLGFGLVLAMGGVATSTVRAHPHAV